MTGNKNENPEREGIKGTYSISRHWGKRTGKGRQNKRKNGKRGKRKGNQSGKKGNKISEIKKRRIKIWMLK